jgi:cytochrome P450
VSTDIYLGTGGLAIIAGSDTTSSAITHLFYFLMCNPTAYKRLQAEIDELGDDILDGTKLAHLPYLNASMFVPMPHHISSI